MRSIAKESACSNINDRNGEAGAYSYLLSGIPQSSEINYDYPEFFLYRDIAFWFKYWLNPDIGSFPNALPVNGTNAPREWNRMDCQLFWQWDRSHNQFNVMSNWQGQNMKCAPDPTKFQRPGGKKTKKGRKTKKAVVLHLRTS